MRRKRHRVNTIRSRRDPARPPLPRVRDTCCTRQINERRAGVTLAATRENPEFVSEVSEMKLDLSLISFR